MASVKKKKEFKQYRLYKKSKEFIHSKYISHALFSSILS